MIDVKEGESYARWHPFKLGTADLFDEDGPYSQTTWVPGWNMELVAPDGGDAREVWDDDGEEIRTVISIHKPGRFPTRVFYTRQYRDPDGKVFGKANCKITTLAAFRVWMRGERWPMSTEVGDTARQKRREAAKNDR